MFRRLHLRGERGQMLVIASLILPVMLGMAALAIDLGNYAAERRTLQNAADSIALAAGQELPNQAAAESAAATWMAKNKVDPTDVTVTVSGGNASPQVRVVISDDHNFTFIRVLGIDNADVGASATAAKLSAGGGSGVVPWSVTQDTLDASASGELITIKYDTNNNPGAGNFGPISVDGSGSSDYESSAKYGATTNICTNLGYSPRCEPEVCPGTFPTACAENSPECDGDECPPKTGNVVGGTRDAVDYRKAYTDPACDTFDEVFNVATAYNNADDAGLAELIAESRQLSSGGRLLAPPEDHGQGSHPTFTPTPTPTDTPGPSPTPAPATATPTAVSGGGSLYEIEPACNPWGAGACDPSDLTDICSRQVFLIPVIDGFGNGTSDPVHILRFALVFLEGYPSGKCSGSDCEIQARFVRAEFTTNSFAGGYDPDALVHFVRLTE